MKHYALILFWVSLIFGFFFGACWLWSLGWQRWHWWIFVPTISFAVFLVVWMISLAEKSPRVG
jgi:hypothetical protein